MTMLVRGGAAGSALPTNATTGQVVQWNGSAWVAATPSASGTTPNATPTVPGLVQLAGDLGGTATAPTVAKINGATPAPVATSGAYGDLTGRPALAPVATSGAYTDLTGRPALAPVATSGSYGDLTNRPLFAPVATSGSYSDLTGRPTVPTQYVTAKAAPSTTTSATAAADPDLQVSLPVGTYALQAFLLPSTGNAANTLVSFGGTAATSGGYSGVAAAAVTGALTTAATITSSGRLGVSGTVVCTAAGSFAAQVASAGAGSQAGLAPGSWLTLTKVA